ncbi:MAG: hypothetical protein R2695_15135 [Acidimicrobiales bacterium]
MSDRTVLIVGSAPQYPQGVVDPIPAIAALAAEAGANCHVDVHRAASCCRSRATPRTVPPWDFRVDGVTSISADIHKLGYARRACPSSSIARRICGYRPSSSTTAGSRRRTSRAPLGAPMAAAGP